MADPTAVLLALEAMPGTLCNTTLARVLVLRWLATSAPSGV